jgi:predicted PurR-regulated permease PerM
VQVRVENAIRDLGNSWRLRLAAASRTFGVLRNTFGLIFGYIIVPFWLFYVLRTATSSAPRSRAGSRPLRRDVDACIRIIQRVLGSYIRAQLTLGLFIGTITAIGLWALGVNTTSSSASSPVSPS